MKIRNVAREQLEAAAAATPGVRMEAEPIAANGRSWKVRLFLPSGEHREYYRTVDAYTERKIAAVNWYGFRDFLFALFAIAPGARVDSGFAFSVQYNGYEDFLSKYWSTGAINVGSVCYPQTPRERCAEPWMYDTDESKRAELLDAVSTQRLRAA